ncbi:hypothetical protein ACFL0T_07735 [Candidatus Omnitrophota bacterium]
MLPQISDPDYLDELLGSKLTWRLLRVLVMQPFLHFRLSDLASRLKTSNQSILRVVRKLSEKGLVLGTVGHHEKYRINPEIRMTRKIWSIFMSERIQRVPQEAIDIILPYFNMIQGKADAFIICEYPSYERMPIFKDRFSIAVVSDKTDLAHIGPVPSHIDMHLFTKNEFSRLDNTVSQNALFNGVVLQGEEFTFGLLVALTAYPRGYILEKLTIYREALPQIEQLRPELQKHQHDLIDKNIHNFETQLHARDYKNNHKTILERIDRLESTVVSMNSKKYSYV